jgi:ribose transport system ATP-binding protein/rhamnose transport system ATP-binding protein
MVFHILKKLKEENVSILLITHSFYEILHYCDKVSIMSEGTITATYSNSQNGYKDQSFLAQMKKLSMDFKYPKLAAKPGKRLLEVDHISVGILKEVTLSLHEGEILGIAGLIGSGRSTLLKAIMGHIKIQAGSIYYEPPLTSHESISIVPENSADVSLFHDCSIPFNIVASNFKKTKKTCFLSNEKTNTYARNYLDKLNISDIGIDSRVKHLSMGNKQKVLVARSLFNRSKVYIFDEASKNLDPASKLELYNIYNALVLEGAAIIMISSDFSELIGMCNRIILLNNGVQIGEYSTDHLSIDALYEKF